LTEYWPPKDSHASFELKMNQSLNDSEYLSIENDEEYFGFEEHAGYSCVKAGCICDIY
jgi:hypothetical protein